MYLLNHVTRKTINVFYFNQSKHIVLFESSLAMQNKTMLFLNYIKQNITSVLCFQRMLRKVQITINYVTQKTITAFCFNQSKHNAIKRNVIFKSN